MVCSDCPNCGTKAIPREFLAAHNDRHCSANLQIAPVVRELHHRNYGVSLANFRDLGGWDAVLRDRSNGVLLRGKVREGLIFRSSSINRATESDTRILVKQLHIKSLLDLRTEEYAGKRGRYLSCFFRVMTKSGSGWVKKKKMRPEQQSVALTPAEMSTMVEQTRESEHWGSEEPLSSYDWMAEEMTGEKVEHGLCFPVGLVGNDFKREMITTAPAKNLVKAGLRYLKGSSPAAYRNAVVCFAFQRAEGLDVLYRMFVDNCEKEVFTFFMTLLAHAELPAVLYCNHGKDRTGFLCALILSICGVDRQIILENYALSDEFLRPIAAHVDSEMAEGGLIPAIMARSPIDVMRGTLNYIDAKHGSVQNYLSSIGFGAPLQELLFYRLVDLRIEPGSVAGPTATSKRAATRVTPDEILQIFLNRSEHTAPCKTPVWQSPSSSPDGQSLALPTTGEPLTFNGTWSRAGVYELQAALLSEDSSHFASVQLSLIYHAKGSSRTVMPPPTILHSSSSIVLVRRVALAESTERLDWRLMVSGATTSTPTCVGIKVFYYNE